MIDARAAMVLALADGPPVEFRATSTTAAAATAITKPGGLEVGDVVFVIAPEVTSGETLTTSGGSAWSRSEISFNAGTSFHVLFWKVLVALDLTNAWNLGLADVPVGAAAAAWIGHGATTLTLKEAKSNGNNTSGTPTTLSFAGITKAAGHFGLLTAMIDKASIGITEPSGSTLRYRANHGTWRVAGAGQTYGYVDGAAVVWTNCDTTASTPNMEVGWLLEVTGP